MTLSKDKPIRSRKYLNTAKGESCINCGRDGTVAAHYSGVGAYSLGKGTGTKVHDICTAHLCNECHREFDSYKDGNNYERGYFFLMNIMKTIIRNVHNGKIKL